MKKTIFGNTIYKGVMGAIGGIAAGLILGLLIWALNDVVTWLIQGGIKNSYNSAPPFSFFTTMGMSFGAIIGSIFGAIAGLKEQKK